KAGSLALKRMALAEAIAHLGKGLELLAVLPASAERDGSELELRILMGTAWTSLKGWAAQEIWDSLHPALSLANALGRAGALVPIFRGLFAYVLNRGRVAESLGWVEQMMKAAEAYGDPDLQIVGHSSAVLAHFWHGDPITVCEHADRVLALYSEERHAHLVEVLNHDPKIHSLSFWALSTWMLGYPEQAAQLREDGEAHARRLGHPFDLGWALTGGSWVFDLLGEPDELLKRAAEADRVGRENSLPPLTEGRVPSFSGMALIRKGQIAEGMAALRRGAGWWGGRPHSNSVLAEGMAQSGDLAGALDLIEEVIAEASSEERWLYAETLRIKGWLL